VQVARNAFRVDLLTQFPWLRGSFASRLVPEGLWIVMMALFVAVTWLDFWEAANTRGSGDLNFFLGLWWPGIICCCLFSLPAWCCSCPFMITAGMLANGACACGYILRQPAGRGHPMAQIGWGRAGVVRAAYVVYLSWEKSGTCQQCLSLGLAALAILRRAGDLCLSTRRRLLGAAHLWPSSVGMNGCLPKLAWLSWRSDQQVCGQPKSTFDVQGGDATTLLLCRFGLLGEGQRRGAAALFTSAQLQES